MKLINYQNWLKMLGFLTAMLTMLMMFADVNAGQQQNSLRPKQVKSFKQLKQLLSAKRIHRSNYLLMRPMTTTDAAAMYTASAAETGAIEHSETNVQVAGVDEGDSVKTDGHYIYRIENGQVRIILAYPADNMASVATLPSANSFSPIELYLQGDQLIVIGSGWQADDSSGNVPVIQEKKFIARPIWTANGESRTVAKVYDISDRTKPVQQREIEFSGSYLSSRKIDDSVYVIGRKYPN